MFYSQSLLSRKGPLGNIWIAAYCFNKLKREQIAGTDISSSIDKIMPEVQISYRILAQLLLGIVRIFSKKVDYLYHDCNEALTNIRRSFIPSQHDVRKKANSGPQDNVIVAKEANHVSKQTFSSSRKRNSAIQIEVMRTAYHDVTISLPERFELDAFDLGVSDVGYATESAKTFEEFILEEEPINERTQDPFANKCLYRTDAHFVHSSACLAPIDDIIPSYMMDIDVQNSEYFNSSCLEEGKWQKAQDNSLHLDELDNRGNLGPSVSEGPRSLDEQSGHQKSEYFNSSSLAGVVQKAQEDSQHHQDELQSHGSLGVSISEGPRSLDEQSEHQIKFQETKPSNMAREVQIDEAKIQAESTNLHSTKPSGLPSPKFAVATPAKRETARILRKRKRNLYDENIVLPNEVLRMWIHDASNLVCKRRKAPHTSLDAWKVHRMINLQEFFMEPLVPCNSLERIATPQKKPCDHSPLKKSEGFTDPAPVQNDVPNNFSVPDDFLLQKTSTDTMTQTDNPEVLKADTSYEGTIKESHSLEISKAGLDILDQEIGLAEKDNGTEADGWSTRTRVVAQYLCRSLLDLNCQKQKKIQGLARILEGQTRAKCARFFCETLTLKSHDYIDVKQDLPYSDIIISATPRLEALFKNQ